MIFKNKKTYVINRSSGNKTNTKSYELLSNDFMFDVTFALNKNKNSDPEMCIIARQGFNMGIFVVKFDQKHHIKFVWWEIKENGEHVYKDIFYHEPLEINKSYNVKLVKKENSFTLIIDDKFEETKKIEDSLYDYTDKLIFIGSANPYCVNNNECWFNGEITDAKIYHSSDEIKDDLYLWFDFEKTSNFKVFDKSGNGNHGIIFESEDKKRKKNQEFNKLARPAKIVNV